MAFSYKPGVEHRLPAVPQYADAPDLGDEVTLNGEDWLVGCVADNQVTLVKPGGGASLVVAIWKWREIFN